MTEGTINTAVECFILGLNHEIALQMMGKRPATLELAINAATIAERYVQQRRDLHIDHSDFRVHRKAKCNLIEPKKEPTTTGFDEQRKCYNCGEVGHLRRDCDKKRPWKPSRDFTSDMQHNFFPKIPRRDFPPRGQGNFSQGLQRNHQPPTQYGYPQASRRDFPERTQYNFPKKRQHDFSPDIEHDHPPKRGRNSKFCNYCKKEGHLIGECRELANRKKSLNLKTVHPADTAMGGPTKSPKVSKTEPSSSSGAPTNPNLPSSH